MRKLGLPLTPRRLRGGLLAALFAVAASAAGATAATAEPGYPFNPTLSVSADTAVAGANPQLAIRLTKPANYCARLIPHSGGLCRLAADTYEEQDFKKLALALPPGLAPDPNAAHRATSDECTFDSTPPPQTGFYSCPEASRIGSVYGLLSNCVDRNAGTPFLCGPPPWIDPEGWPLVGDVYLGEPGPGEQSHLVLLVGLDDISTPGVDIPHVARADVSITVAPDGRIAAVADNIPDTVMAGFNPALWYFGEQPYDLTLTLEGATGLGAGHPLLTNPTSCEEKQTSGEAQGYLYNPGGIPHGQTMEAFPGYGEGTTVPVTSGYPVTACDALPYAPTFALKLDPQAPDGVPAIEATVTQAKGEQTTGSVSVTFPSEFKINTENKATQCTDDEWAQNACPAESAIGTAAADSDLLPIGSGPLTGNVYLGQTDVAAGNVKLMTKLSNGFLPGGIDLEGNGHLNAAGSIQTDFANVPDLPIQSFTLSLQGGAEKGLVKTPKVCAPYTVTSEFTSHAGKTKENSQPVQIAGCEGPALDVELSTKKPGRPVDLDLSLGSTGTAIDTVELRLARQLGWGKRKGRGASAAKKKALRSIGLATFTTKQGEQKVRIKAKKTKRGNLTLAPLQRKTSQGQLVATQVPSFAATLFRTAQRQPALAKRSKGKAGRKARRQTDLAFSGFPQDQLTRMELSLRGADRRRSFFLKTPTGCKKPLNFVAIVTTTDGRKLVAKDEVKLKGRGCR